MSHSTINPQELLAEAMRVRIVALKAPEGMARQEMLKAADSIEESARKRLIAERPVA